MLKSPEKNLKIARNYITKPIVSITTKNNRKTWYVKKKEKKKKKLFKFLNSIVRRVKMHTLAWLPSSLALSLPLLSLLRSPRSFVSFHFAVNTQRRRCVLCRHKESLANTTNKRKTERKWK